MIFVCLDSSSKYDIKRNQTSYANSNHEIKLLIPRKIGAFTSTISYLSLDSNHPIIPINQKRHSNQKDKKIYFSAETEHLIQRKLPTLKTSHVPNLRRYAPREIIDVEIEITEFSEI